jgi:gamma-glutamylcyclotransferase (GGCT)/AIG2-like uncharacterized protein YtfP
MPDLLFIYGTLHPERAPAAIAATARRLRPLGRAVIGGRRYELGEYPGVVLSGDMGDQVWGEVFLLPEGAEGAEVLARMDAYEDFRPGDRSGSLFLRERTQATLEDGTRRACWVYTYNRPLPENL